MSFPRYPSYQESGVEWLGEVPGWSAVPGWRAKGPARSQPGATPQVRRSDGLRAKGPVQACADGSPLQGWCLRDPDTQGVALGWFGPRRWRWEGGAA